jgi:opacity protein-like surface antigen
MEKEEKDILDKLFQSKLHDFEVETDPSDWEAISRRLDKSKSIPFHKALYYWAAAAVIALLILTGGIYLYNHADEEQTMTEIANKYTQNTNPLMTEQQEQPITVVQKKEKTTNVIASAAIVSAVRPTMATTANPIESISPKGDEKEIASNKTENIQPEERKNITSNTVETKSQTEESEGNTRFNAQPSSNSFNRNAVKLEKGKNKKKHIKRWGFGMGGGSLSTEFNSISSFGDMTANYANMNDIPLRLNNISSYQAADRDVNSSYLQNFSLMNINSFSAKTNVHHKRPISFGVGISYMLNNRLYLLSGLNYSYLSSSWETNNDYNIKTTQKLHFLGVPLSVSYKIAEWHHLNFYTAAGGMAEINVAGKLSSKLYDIEKGTEENSSKNIRMKPWQWSINGRIGVSYPLWRFLSIYTEAGIGYYFDNGSEIETIHNEKPFDVSLQAGFRLGF